MSKRINNVWEEIFSFENLMLAFFEVRRSKNYMRALMKYEDKLEENLIELLDELNSGKYKPQKMREFYVYEPKMRLIEAPFIRDRIVHQCLMLYLQKFYTQKYCKSLFSSVKGRGTYHGALYLSKMIRSAKEKYKEFYFLKMDIHKYFKNINHNILLSILEKHIADERLLDLFKVILTQNGYVERGLPIGSLSSQLFANVYLNMLDKFIIHDLGIKYFTRFMDDFVIITNTKEEANLIYKKIEIFLYMKLNLKLNPKSSVSKFSRSIYFCGYRCFERFLKPRKRIIRKFIKRTKLLNKLYEENKVDMKYIQEIIASYYGYVLHCKNYNSLMKHIEKFNPEIQIFTKKNRNYKYK